MSIDAVLARLNADFGNKEVLDAADLAQVLGKSAEATNTLIRREGLPLPVMKVGGRNCVSKQAVAVWLAGNCIENNKSARVRPGEAEPLPPPTRKRPNIAGSLLCLTQQIAFLTELHHELDAVLLNMTVPDIDQTEPTPPIKRP